MNMRKILGLVLACSLLLGLGACAAGQAAPSAVATAEPSAAPTETAEPDTSLQAAPSDPATISDLVTPSPTPEAVDWAGIYTAYISENKEHLENFAYPGFTGAGFIDLDLDGTPELVLFDTGASAAMGVWLFDIVDGTVQCISSGVTLDESHRGPWYSQLVINAGYFEDFMLYRSTQGDSFFISSGNGAEDFYYRELIRFGRNENDVLTLESVAFQYVENDLDGNVVSARYTLSGQDADEAAYNAFMEQFQEDYIYSGYEPAGVFIWGEEQFAPENDGLLQMIQAAVDAYVPAP